MVSISMATTTPSRTSGGKAEASRVFAALSRLTAMISPTSPSPVTPLASEEPGLPVLCMAAILPAARLRLDLFPWSGLR